MTHQTIQDISERINQLVKKMTVEKLSQEELSELEKLSQKLYERAVILSYKAKEEVFHSSSREEQIIEKKEEPKPIVQEAPVQETVEETVVEEEIQFDFSSGFDAETENPVEVQQEPTPVVTETPVVEITTSQDDFYQFFEKFYREAQNDKIGHAKINSLKGAFGLNDRMLFINELFSGNSDLFNETIEHLDSLEDNEKALQKLSELAKIQNWDKTQSSVEEFAHIINRRYVD